MGIYVEAGTKLLARAGVTVNGKNPWDIQAKDPDMLSRKAFTGGQLAICEYYMEGGWHCDDLFGMFCRIFESGVERELKGFANFLLFLKAKLRNMQSEELSWRVARDHYDLGNPIYELFLDPSMTYSAAGPWVDVDGLNEAQLQKLAHICDKAYPEPGMNFLDIGCGWGGLPYYLAKNHGVNVVGLTLAEQQAIKARERCAGLPVKILVEDYRKHHGRYHRVVSVGMIEHVGVRNYPAYFEKAFDFLEQGGLFVCHGIVGKPGAKSPFLDKYIFPGGELGATWQIAKAAEKAGFITEDWENFGNCYSLTLQAWHKNFTRNWSKIEPLITPDILRVFGTRERFRRAWDIYLLADAALFHVRDTSVGQYVFSKGLIGQRYKAVRL